MLKVLIPNKFVQERTYLLKVLLGEFLGLEYSIAVSDLVSGRIEGVLPNGNRLELIDSFFKNFCDGLDYLNKIHLPADIAFHKLPFIPEEDIPILYGKPQILETNEGAQKNISCHVDILASSFVLLTRWEEYVVTEKDEHNRFRACDSLAVKGGFIHRPVVNEYCELLWNMLRVLGIEQYRKERQFQYLITHDVDIPLCWDKKGLGTLGKKLAGDLLLRRSMKQLKSNFNSYRATQNDIKRDPYNTFDFLMGISEKHGLKSHFFLKSDLANSEFDNRYSLTQPFVKELIGQIIQRGHTIGFHPSYRTYNNPSLWEREFEQVASQIATPLTCGRQHFLRFDAPLTWRMWEDCGFSWESSLGFPEVGGFRCGTCFEYSVFDFINRKPLALKERPLIVMECSYFHYQNKSPEKMEEKINVLIDQVKKYSGCFVLLWHNSSFHFNWEAYAPVYEKIINYNSKSNTTKGLHV